MQTVATDRNNGIIHNIIRKVVAFLDFTFLLQTLCNPL